MGSMPVRTVSPHAIRVLALSGCISFGIVLVYSVIKIPKRYREPSRNGMRGGSKIISIFLSEKAASASGNWPVKRIDA